jgi:hypothetical protein
LPPSPAPASMDFGYGMTESVDFLKKNFAIIWILSKTA